MRTLAIILASSSLALAGTTDERVPDSAYVDYGK